MRGRNGVSSHDNAHACEGSCRETHTTPHAQPVKGSGVRALCTGEFCDPVEGLSRRECKETHPLPDEQRVKGLEVQAIRGGEFLQSLKGLPCGNMPKPTPYETCKGRRV